VLVPLSHDLVHEAVILGRPLFTDSLALTELASVDEMRRRSLVVGWTMSGLERLRGALRDQGSRGQDVTSALAALREREAEVRSYASRHGCGMKHWQPDDHAKELADAHGRGNEYSALLVAQMFIHGTWAATSERYGQTDEGVMVVGGFEREPKRWERDTGLWASVSMIHGARAACRLFRWAEPTELGVLLEQLRQEAQRSGDSSA
jgi:hypothetical protein